MGRILLWIIVIYALGIAGYVIWAWLTIRRQKRRRLPVEPPIEEDIIIRFGFDRSHSLPQATTLIKSEKRDENDSTFAAGNAENALQRPSPVVPLERLNAAFSSDRAEGFEEVEDFDGGQDDFDEEGDERPLDKWESEGEALPGDVAPGRTMATGVRFDELSGMMQTVEAPDAATSKERVQAGRTLVEVRKTDMFEQVVSGKPEKRENVGLLMDEYLDDFYRRKREEAGDADDDSGIEVPDDFNPRDYDYSRKMTNK